jgi:rare lipoprotein A
MKKALFLMCWLAIIEAGPALTQVKMKAAGKSKIKRAPRSQYGTATIYHSRFHGRKTASGTVYNQRKLTAAHNSVPLGTWLKVTNLRNRKFVFVKVTDRLHFRNRRLVDLSKAAATKVGFSESGLLQVKVQIIGHNKSVEASL